MHLNDYVAAALVGLFCGFVLWVVLVAAWGLLGALRWAGPVAPLGWPLWAALGFAILICILMLAIDSALIGVE